MFYDKSDIVAANLSSKTKCLFQVAPRTGCSPLDLNCICNSHDATTLLTPCILHNCTAEESLSQYLPSHCCCQSHSDIYGDSVKVRAKICDRPHDSLQDGVRDTLIITGIIPVFVIILRICSRLASGARFWWDDWLHISTGVRFMEGGKARHVTDVSDQAISIMLTVLGFEGESKRDDEMTRLRTV